MSMIGHNDFLLAIQAAEDPCFYQSIYADWLEEQGDSRAELIRLSFEIRKFPKAPQVHSESALNPATYRNKLEIYSDNAFYVEWVNRMRLPRIFGNRLCLFWTWKEGDLSQSDFNSFVRAVEDAQFIAAVNAILEDTADA